MDIPVDACFTWLPYQGIRSSPWSCNSWECTPTSTYDTPWPHYIRIHYVSFQTKKFWQPSWNSVCSAIGLACIQICDTCSINCRSQYMATHCNIYHRNKTLKKVMPPATCFFSAGQKKSKLINSTLKNQLEQWGPCMRRGRGVLQFQHHTPLSIGINDKVSGRVKIWEVVRCIALVNKSWVMMHITDPMTGPIIKSNKIHTSPHPEGLGLDWDWDRDRDRERVGVVGLRW